jgi:hypothetical protein
MLGVGREAIVLTTRYVMQQGARTGHTVGLKKDLKKEQAVEKASVMEQMARR